MNRQIKIWAAVAVLLCALVFVKAGGMAFVRSLALFSWFSSIYSDMLGQGAAFLSSVFGGEVFYANGILLSSEGITLQVAGYFWLRYIAAITALMLFFPFSPFRPFAPSRFRAFALFAAALLLLYFFTALHISLKVIYPQYARIYTHTIEIIIHLMLFGLFYYKLHYNTYLQKFRKKADDFCRGKFELMFLSGVLILLLLDPLINLIYQNFVQHSAILTPWLTKLTLFLSFEWLSLFGYDVTIYGHYMILGQKAVSIVPACLGIKVMLTFITLLMIVKNRWSYKAIYGLISIVLMHVMNGGRIALILYLLAEKSLPFGKAHEIGLYSYYAFVFLLFLVYLRRKSDGEMVK